MVKYTVPYIPDSLNRFAGRKNQWEYREKKQQWKGIIAAYCRPRPQVPFARARVELEYFFPTRARHDPDNYSGKMILDGLVQCGIIADDSFDCIILSIKGGYDKQNPRTEISVEGA